MSLTVSVEDVEGVDGHGSQSGDERARGARLVAQEREKECCMPRVCRLNGECWVGEWLAGL